MNKKEYVVGQLRKTIKKKYESYVVNRIINLIDDFEIKFITQQYISRPRGRALTDLYFPQFKLHVEVDEGHHKSPQNIVEDKVREIDIVNATGHEILRVDVTKSLEEINTQIDQIILLIKNRRKNPDFIPWDIDLEFSPETYISRGYIDISDDVAFKTIKDACNCFGHNYAGYQQAAAAHPNPEIMLWFPKLYPNGLWNNKISFDEEQIIEKHEDEEIAKQHIRNHLESNSDKKHQRIVFARVKGNLGKVLYRFRGLYKLDLEQSNESVGLVWKRIATRVNTYQHIS